MWPAPYERVGPFLRRHKGLGCSCFRAQCRRVKRSACLNFAAAGIEFPQDQVTCHLRRFQESVALATDTSAAFFSYCSADSEFALQLAGDLKAAGACVWMDQLDIRPGRLWDRSVEDALSTCPRMVVILSPASISSINVMDEVSFALEQQKTVIPVLLRDCKVPFRLRRLQYVNFRNDYDLGLKELLKTLLTDDRQQERNSQATLEQEERARPAERDTALPPEASMQRVRGLKPKCESVRQLRTLRGHSDEVLAVTVTPDGTLVVSTSRDKTLKVWDLGSGLELLTLRGHTSRVTAVTVTQDGTLAVSASEDETLKVWDLGSGHELRTLGGHSNIVRGVAVTPDGMLAVSASDDRTLKVWDLATGRDLRTLEGHRDYVRATAVMPNGQMAISASFDKTVKVWDLGTGCELRTLSGHDGYVNGVAVTPDGKLAVSASADTTLKVWDLSTGRELLTFAANARLDCCVVAPDGKTILAGDADGTISCLCLE